MDAAHGTQQEVNYSRGIHCDSCEGSGLKDGASPTNCSTCGGAGRVVQQQGFLRLQTVCPACRGAGQSIDPRDQCDDCNGSGQQRSDETVQVSIPAGVDHGTRLRLVGKGEGGDPGAPPGDLYVVLKVKPHELFKREGPDTYCSLQVPYPVMVLGGEITIPTVHGEEPMTVPTGCESGKVFHLRGKGIDRVNGRGPRGDHHVQLVVEVPKKVNEEETELLKQLAELHEQKVHETGFWKGLFAKLTS